MSHDEFLRCLENVKVRRERRKSSPGKRKAQSSQQLHKRMCKVEETLDRLSLFLNSSQDSPFSGFQSPIHQVDFRSQGTDGAACPGAEMVPATAASTITQAAGVPGLSTDTGKMPVALTKDLAGSGGGFGDCQVPMVMAVQHSTRDTEVESRCYDPGP
ncbi:hypothetical protein E2C01_083941 [Portunus trituberculatus]|uniref:Uncharacterized protein n=1 Tax=Portunus trituberculatus TaxID=210409 RepID=A0A5B7J3J5_PORTR|nr:hypothetical protein [Portunus trituberculatus]